MIRTILIMGLIAFFFTVTSCGGGGGGSSTGGSSSTGEIDGSSTGGERNPVCSAGQSSGEVSRPEFVRNLTGQTSWFASPIVADLDDDSENELIAAYYSLYVFSQSGDLIDRVDGNGSRIYAPHVVVDLEGDGTVEIVCGQGRHVYAYEWRNRKFSLKSGWPADTTCADSSPEVRGLAAADLDGNGELEIMVQTFDHGMDIFTVHGICRKARRLTVSSRVVGMYIFLNEKYLFQVILSTDSVRT